MDEKEADEVIEFLREVARGADKDSDFESLLETFKVRATTILEMLGLDIEGQ